MLDGVVVVDGSDGVVVVGGVVVLVVGVVVLVVDVVVLVVGVVVLVVGVVVIVAVLVEVVEGVDDPAMALVGSEVATVVPFLLLAVTITRNAAATSVGAGRYV